MFDKVFYMKMLENYLKQKDLIYLWLTEINYACMEKEKNLMVNLIPCPSSL